MISKAYITEWQRYAPWPDPSMVEQDLVICRALIDIFNHPVLKENLAFRGGTALFKLHMPAARYSEDIDLVQVNAEPIGELMGSLREVLDPWLGQPTWKQTQGRVTFRYRFDSEEGVPLCLKVEINTREHFTVYGFLATIIGTQFFPNEDKTIQLISTFGIFAAGYLMRPLGGVVFGYIGDKYGRKKALLYSVLLMAIPTTLMAFLPTYESIGWYAALLLVVLRLLQGLSVGGEFTNSMSFLAEKAPEPRSEVKILAVQSNVNFREKLFSENVPEIIKNQLALTLSDPRSFSVDMIVWPETAVPTDLLGEKTFLEQLEIVPRRTGASLLTGAALSRVGRDLNGAVLLGPDGVPNGIYAKRKLVPFVEWVPEFFRSEKLRWLLGKYSYSFAVGNKAGLFCLGNTKPSQPFGVLICSEDLFGGLFRDYKRGGAGYAVELLNDGWFERDEALLLHAQNSIMSAVENRMPVVRVSNTGWTCSIDRVGRVVMPSSSEFNSAKNFLFTVYPRGNAGWRFLSGDFFCLIALGFVIIFMLFDHRRNIR